MKHWLFYFYFLQLCNFLIKLILPWLQGPKFKISSPALLSIWSTPCQTLISETPQAQSKPRHFVLTAVSSFLLRFHKPSRHSSSNLFSLLLFFAHIRLPRLESFSFCSVSLNLLYISIPIINPTAHIWVFAIGSLTRFLTPPSIPLSFCYASSPQDVQDVRHPKTQNQIQGCPVLILQKYIKNSSEHSGTSMKKIKSIFPVMSKRTICPISHYFQLLLLSPSFLTLP